MVAVLAAEFADRARRGGRKIPPQKQLRGPSPLPCGFLHGLRAVAGDRSGLEGAEAPQASENHDAYGAWSEGPPHALSLQ